MTGDEQSPKDERSPDDKSQTADGVPAQRPLAQSPVIPQTAQGRRFALSSKLLTIAVLLAVGGGAAIWAAVIYPSSRTVETPSGYAVFITAERSNILRESLSFKREPHGLIVVSSNGLAAPAEPSGPTGPGSTAPPGSNTPPPPPPPGNTGAPGNTGPPPVPDTMTIVLYGRDAKVVNCPSGGNCGHGTAAPIGPPGNQVDITVPLSAQATAEFKDPSFGFDKTDEMAVAQLPSVFVLSPNSGAFVFTVGYNIQDANKYDWSTPAQTTSPDGATWQEPVTPAGTLAQSVPESELTGINHGAQRANDNSILLAGVLLGILGSALLSAIQEALHKPGKQSDAPHRVVPAENRIRRIMARIFAGLISDRAGAAAKGDNPPPVPGP